MVSTLIVVAVLVLNSRDASAITCTFHSVVGVSFGSYDVFGFSALDSTGNVTYRCTDVTEFDTITIDISQGGALSYAPRRMAAGTASLSYNLFLDAARTQVWGDGGGGETARYGPTTPPEATNVSVTVYGRVPARQDVAVGSYSDTVTVTLNY
jgi:spore coat protein U-like protein